MDFQQKSLDIFGMDSHRIPGIMYLENYISPKQEQLLTKHIDQSPWIDDLKRRVQHYGYRYNYRQRRAAKDLYLGPLPNWIDTIATQLFQDGYFNTKPDQVIINEYLPGQGISKHIDCQPCFGNVIASLSLGSGAMMYFEKEEQREEIYLEPCSLIVLSNEARHDWTHAIPQRQSDMVQGMRLNRTRRLSLTFRTMNH